MTRSIHAYINSKVQYGCILSMMSTYMITFKFVMLKHQSMGIYVSLESTLYNCTDSEYESIRLLTKSM